MLHGDDHLGAGGGDQVHGPAHPLHQLARDHPVGQVTKPGHLHSHAEYTGVYCTVVQSTLEYTGVYCTAMQSILEYTGNYYTAIQSILEYTPQPCRVYWSMLEFSEVYKNLLECTDLHCTEYCHVNVTTEG